jgi:hypothetical protein
MLCIFTAQFTSSEKALIDALTTCMSSNLCSTRKNRFPKSNFKKDITNLSLQTADEWMVSAFVFLCIAHTHAGEFILFKRMTKEDSDWGRSSLFSSHEVSHLFEFRSRVDDRIPFGPRYVIMTLRRSVFPVPVV